MRKTISVLLSAWAILAAASASALPATYTYTAGAMSGTLNGVAYGPTSLTFVVKGDTNGVNSTSFVYGTGPCVTGTSATVAVGVAAPIDLTSPATVCITTNGQFLGVYGAGGASDFLHFDGTVPGVDLKNNIAPTPLAGSLLHNFGGSSFNTAQGMLSITGGGSAVNASFTAAVTAAASAPASIPTLSEWGLILTSAMVGLFGFAWMRRRN